MIISIVQIHDKKEIGMLKIKNMRKVVVTICCLLAIIISSSAIIESAFAQTQNLEESYNQARQHMENGEYGQANAIYDNILENQPNNISVLKMKGIVQSNQGDHVSSLKQFFKVLQNNPNDVMSLTGMGIGFGNLGEYQEAAIYFDRALKEKPNNTVINNFNEYADKVIKKYPYIPTEKPKGLEKIYITTIPEWVKSVAKWWSEESIEDEEFISAILHLIENKIIIIPPVENKSVVEDKIPKWIKNNAGWWADGRIDDDSFVSGIQYMIQSGTISINVEKENRTQQEIDHEYYLFKKYLRDISNNIVKEIRYIEYPNPSKDVIKKFLRDYVKWNFEDEVKTAATRFPSPAYEVIDDAYIIHYKVFINSQPTGLPLDHVSTLKNSFLFWENQELTTNNQKAKIKFEITNKKGDANVWVTWVVRDIGEGVLGHAHLGKGVVEVTLGDHRCDGSFQLYDIKSVETIMTHELGHSVGLNHISEKNNIMYPTYTPKYAYCILG
jgi:tetratricopeptide (TPR) repeat protein